MADLYWLITLGTLGEALSAITILFGFALFVCTIIYAIYHYENYEQEMKQKHTKALKRALPIWVITLLLAIFTPSKEQLFLIYGVGGTIDYLKENPTAKQLPDKCIKVLEKWADEQLKEK